MTNEQISKLKTLDIIRYDDSHGYVNSGLVLEVMWLEIVKGNRQPMIKIMFESADKGVEVRNYTPLSLWKYYKVEG